MPRGPGKNHVHRYGLPFTHEGLLCQTCGCGDVRVVQGEQGGEVEPSLPPAPPGFVRRGELAKRYPASKKLQYGDQNELVRDSLDEAELVEPMTVETVNREANKPVMIVHTPDVTPLRAIETLGIERGGAGVVRG